MVQMKRKFTFPETTNITEVGMSDPLGKGRLFKVSWDPPIVMSPTDTILMDVDISNPERPKIKIEVNGEPDGK
jgi:hypothetical protein